MKDNKMFRVYVYYLKSSRKKDFDSKKDALNYAHRIANNGKAPHITIENIDTYEILLDLYPEI